MKRPIKLAAAPYIDFDDLGVLDWDAIHAPTWSDSSGIVDPEKRWRRSAEFLVWWRVNLSRIDTIACNNDVTRQRIVALLNGRKINVRISKQSFFMWPQRG